MVIIASLNGKNSFLESEITSVALALAVRRTRKKLLLAHPFTVAAWLIKALFSTNMRCNSVTTKVLLQLQDHDLGTICYIYSDIKVNIFYEFVNILINKLIFYAQSNQTTAKEVECQDDIDESLNELPQDDPYLVQLIKDYYINSPSPKEMQYNIPPKYFGANRILVNDLFLIVQR